MIRKLAIVALIISCIQLTYSQDRTFENYDELESYVLKGLKNKHYEQIENILWGSLDKYPDKQHVLTNYLLLCYESTHDYVDYLRVLEYTVSKDIYSCINPWVNIDSLYKYPHGRSWVQANDSIKQVKWLQIRKNFYKHNNSKNDSVVKVTYIGNCGYFVQTINSKILIDAIFTHQKVDSPDSITLRKIINGQEPYGGVDIVFVTHNHPDHCNLNLLHDFMLTNSNTQLVCPDQLVYKLRDKYDLESYQNNITAIKYDTINPTDIKINNVNIKALNGDHAGKRYKKVNNVNYFIQVDGVVLFHTGDSEPAVLEKWSKTIDFPLRVNIAFLRNIYSNYIFEKQYITADYQVYMHIDNFNKKMVMTGLINNKEHYNNPYIFNELNETVLLEID